MSSSFSLATLAPQTLELSRLTSFWPIAPHDQTDTDLADHIATHNLLHPLLALEPVPGQNLALVDGYRRQQALLTLGQTAAPTLIIPKEIPLAQALTLALTQNRERGFNPAEVALRWSFLSQHHPILAPILAPTLAPVLNLQSPKSGQWCLAAARLPQAGLVALAQGRLDLENAARISGWDPTDQQALLDLFELLNPSKQKKRLWMDWLEDLARREKCGISQLLATPEIEAALAEVDRLGRPAVEEKIRLYLWNRRHPLLGEMVNQRQARLKALKLPPTLRLELDPTLEDIKFNLNLYFTTLAEFKNLADQTRRLTENEDFRSLIDDCPHD